MKQTNNIEIIRKKLNLSRQQLSEYLGVTPSAICNYEKGVRNPRINTCRKLISLASNMGMKITLNDILIA